MPTPLQDATAALKAAIQAPTDDNCRVAAAAIARLASARTMRRLADAGLLADALADDSKTLAEASAALWQATNPPAPAPAPEPAPAPIPPDQVVDQEQGL